MTGKGNASSRDDCFARFDEAFARLESELRPAGNENRDKTAAPVADLSEYEEAFTNIDRQLDAHSPSLPADLPQAPASRSVLALVPPTGGSAGADSPPPEPATHALEELWRQPSTGGTSIERLVITIQNLLWLHRAIEARDIRVSDNMRLEHVADMLAETRRLCAEWQLQSACVRADFTLAALKDDKLDVLAAEIAELVRHIRHDLQSCSISPTADDHSSAFDASLDPASAMAFPTAADELTEATRCATGHLMTAAVFHLMRAASCGRRALAAALPLKDKDREPADWAATILLLEHRIADLTNWPAGPMRKAGKDFFVATLNDARLLHAAEQRVTHDGSFDEHFAIVVLNTTRSFLDRLASYTTERAPTRLTRQMFGPRT